MVNLKTFQHSNGGVIMSLTLKPRTYTYTTGNSLPLPLPPHLPPTPTYTLEQIMIPFGSTTLHELYIQFQCLSSPFSLHNNINPTVFFLLRLHHNTHTGFKHFPCLLYTTLTLAVFSFSLPHYTNHHTFTNSITQHYTLH